MGPYNALHVTKRTFPPCVKPPKKYDIHSSSLTKAIHKLRIARLIFLLKNTRSSQYHMKKLLTVASHDSMLLSKVTTIKEAKDLATLPINKLIGNLKVYEMILENGSDKDEDEEEEFNSIVKNLWKLFKKGNRFKRENRFGNGGDRFDRGHSNRRKGVGSSRGKRIVMVAVARTTSIYDMSEAKIKKALIGVACDDEKMVIKWRRTQHVLWQSVRKR
ncbi:hypothetical protein Tco_1211307 [Tanacetum coccineum]